MKKSMWIGLVLIAALLAIKVMINGEHRTVIQKVQKAQSWRLADRYEMPYIGNVEMAEPLAIVSARRRCREIAKPGKQYWLKIQYRPKNKFIISIYEIE